METEDELLQNPALTFQEYNEIRDRQDRKGATIMKLALQEIDIELRRLREVAKEIRRTLETCNAWTRPSS